MPSEEYIKKYSQKKLVRTREQIQQPFEKPQKHIVPQDLIIGIKPIVVLDPKLLDLKSKLIWQFIRNER